MAQLEFGAEAKDIVSYLGGKQNEKVFPAVYYAGNI